MRGGRGLISCEDCVRGEKNGLGLYAKDSRKTLLRKVGETSIVRTKEAIEPNEYRMCKSKVREDEWKQKPMHGKFVSDKEGLIWEKSWQWKKPREI